MIGREKRPTLSSTLLDSKDAPPGGKASAPANPETASAGGAQAAQTRDPLLFSKGSASASGFKPWYWSYEREDGSPSENSATVMPFPVTNPTIQASQERSGSTPADSMQETAAVEPRSRRSLILPVAAAGVCVILGIAIGSFVFSGQPHPSATPASPPVAVAQPPQVEPAAPIVPKEPTPSVALAPPAPAAPADAAPADNPVASEPSPEVAKARPEEIAELIERGNQLLDTGDIAAARVFYERAAEQGSGLAAMDVGKTYDPLFLEQLHARGFRGDVARAIEWYRKAIVAGEPQAEPRLNRLTAKRPG